MVTAADLNGAQAVDSAGQPVGEVALAQFGGDRSLDQVIVTLAPGVGQEEGARPDPGRPGGCRDARQRADRPDRHDRAADPGSRPGRAERADRVRASAPIHGGCPAGGRTGGAPARRRRFRPCVSSGASRPPLRPASPPISWPPIHGLSGRRPDWGAAGASLPTAVPAVRDFGRVAPAPPPGPGPGTSPRAGGRWRRRHWTKRPDPDTI